MPTNRRKIVRTGKKIEITEDQLYHLKHGYTLLSYCTPFFGRMSYPFENDRHRRQLWEKYKVKILADYEKDKRPAAWWNYSAPEKRRIVSGDASLAMWKKGEYFGKCRVYDIETWSDPNRPKFESQKQYLKRLNL